MEHSLTTVQSDPLISVELAMEVQESREESCPVCLIILLTGYSHKNQNSELLQGVSKIRLTEGGGVFSTLPCVVLK